MNFEKINVEQFNYSLPEEKIAQFPHENRDEANLLIFRDEKIHHALVKELPNWISKLNHPNIILNDTKVVPARLIFSRGENVKPIEIFYMDPVNGSIEDAMQSKKSLKAWCKVRNSKKWKHNLILKRENLTASKLGQNGDKFQILFSWNSEDNWSEILRKNGETPLPPYMKRPSNKNDNERYQTVFSKVEGSVAAPTAGLHLTSKMLNKIQKNSKINYVQLHIGAGTFQPISENTISKHEMHSEEVHFSIETIESLKENKDILAVGTTSARAIESLYWLSIELFNGNEEISDINQWAPYKNYDKFLSRDESLIFLTNYMRRNKKKSLHFNTSIIIIPGYKFKFIDLILTNFHQPKSTLLLLIAATIGDDWRKVYDYALENNYRFLSYGDACLLKIKK